MKQQKPTKRNSAYVGTLHIDMRRERKLLWQCIPEDKVHVTRMLKHRLKSSVILIVHIQFLIKLI